MVMPQPEESLNIRSKANIPKLLKLVNGVHTYPNLLSAYIALDTDFPASKKTAHNTTIVKSCTLTNCLSLVTN
ncbi:MAG: hypothetical protein RLZZ171_735 [Cyanobacteriota bacterium]|jgi:hypothetical protein